MKRQKKIEQTLSSALLVASLGLLANGAQATETQPESSSETQNTISQISEGASPAIFPLDPALVPPEPEDPMAQISGVSQLRDVYPSDWAYQALSDLISRYSCLVGYPDGTFRGNRPTSRYEFAAGLNACLQQMERILAEATANLARKEDLEILKRLMDEFRVELDALGNRVDSLEARTTFLEDNQFSTTTKLFGQAIIGVQGRNQTDFNLFNISLTDRDDEINLIHNVQLSLFTQFSPRSLLLTSFQGGDGNTGRTFTDTLGNYVGLAYEGDSDNVLRLSDLNYRHLIGSNLAVMVGPRGISPVNVFRGANRVESAGSGPLSRFAQRNPIINIGGGQGGLGFDWQISSKFSFQGVYASSDPENSSSGGLFGGDNASTTLGAQLVVSPTDTIDISLHYINSYSPFGILGMGVGDDNLIIRGFSRGPMSTNAFGLSGEWQIAPIVSFGGWAGWTTSNYQAGSGSVETFNWMTYLNFPDLFGEGNLAGLYFGQPPMIIGSDLPDGRNWPSFITNGNINAVAGGQPGTTYHLEAFYRIRISDNINITPGAIVVFNPLQNARNNTIFIGALRTTFSF